MIENVSQHGLDANSICHMTEAVENQRHLIENYLLKLNQHLCADLVFIAKANEDYSEATSLITISEQKLVANFSYPLPHSPCARVFDSNPCVYPKDVAKLFPKDAALTAMGIVGYLGLPIVSESNSPVGILVALFRREITQVDSLKYSFEVFAAHLSNLLQTASLTATMHLQNRLLQEVSRTAKVAYWQLDTNSGWLEWSPQAQEIFDITHDAQKANLETLIDLVYAPDVEKAECFFRQVMQRKNSKSVSFNIKTKSGGIRSVQCKVCDENANASITEKHFSDNAVIGVIQDISDIRHMSEELETSQKELRDQEEMFLNIMDCSPTVIYVKDTKGIYLYANKKYLDIFQITREDIIGKNDLSIFPETTAKELMDNDERVIKTRAHLELEEQVPHPDGFRLYLSEKFPLINREGEVYALCGISTDITDRRAQEIKLQQSQKMEAIGQLAGGIAHDFNNQLASILGFAELSAASNDSAQIKGYLTKIISSAENSGGLTKKLLAFSRKEEGEYESLDLHALIGETIELFKHTLDKRITIQTFLKAAECFALGNKSAMQNALINLGLNARDAMPSGGTISISTTLETAEEVLPYFDVVPYSHNNMFIRLDFSDTGTGMSESVLSRIFEPFFTTKEPSKGTGMGLASVYGTIERMKGQIHVKSKQGNGSCFAIRLPLSESTEEKTHINESIDDPPSTTRRTVLLVDDEPSIRNLCAEFFDLLGYKGLFAADGAEAVSLYRRFGSEIDLVIMDMLMPNMTGEEAMQKIQEIDPSVRLIFSSGYTAQLSKEELLSRGVLKVIQKPYRLLELKQSIEEILP